MKTAANRIDGRTKRSKGKYVETTKETSMADDAGHPSPQKKGGRKNQPQIGAFRYAGEL